VGLGLAGALLGACAAEPLPTSTAADRTLSEEIFRILCKRVAKTAYPKERTGVRFDAPCEGTGPADTADVDPTLAGEAARFQSIVSRRPATVNALNEWFGRGQLDGGAVFADGELDNVLRSLVPFYGDSGKPETELIPNSTRGLADVLAKLVDPADTRSQEVLKTLARIGPRKGYRNPSQALGALRPILGYNNLDALGQSLLAVLSGTDAQGNPAAGQAGLLATLRGLALELALPAEPPEQGDSTLDILLRDLLFKPHKGLENAPQAFIVARDENGNAKGNAGGATPFAVKGEQGVARDANGLVQGYEYIDVGRSVLSGLVREAKMIATPSFNNTKSALENLGAGIRPIYGTRAQRSQTFGANNYTFEGASLTESPLFDLAHALAAALRYPETERALRLFAELVDKQEDASASVDRLALTLREISKKPDYAKATLTGTDGTPNSPSDFWDDVIGIGDRMLKRNGMITAMIRSFANPKGAKQGKLYGSWMRYKDEFTYVGAPLTPNATDVGGKPGAYSLADKQKMNTPIPGTYVTPVDRSQPDVGMNRSVWQRTMNLIKALNGEPVCNKEGATLTVYAAVIGPLTFPAVGSFKKCDLLEIQDQLEIFGQAVIGRARIDLKDVSAVGLGSISAPVGLVDGVPPGSSFGNIQEVYTQIDGLTDRPTAQAMARFLFAPPNAFTAGIVEPTLTATGLPLLQYEPNSLFQTEIKVPAADNKSLNEVGGALIEALDDTELRGPDGKLVDGYMYGNMLAMLGDHWPSRSLVPCSEPIVPGTEGCTDHVPGSKFYATQSNVQSYEPMLAEMLIETDTTEILQKAAAVVDSVSIDGKKGLDVLGEFVQRMLTPDPKLAYRDGRKWTKTNSCVVSGTADAPTCQGDVGRIIEQTSPLYMMLDALKGIDAQFAKPENAPKLDAWHAARSALVDQFLSTEVNPDGTTRLSNQNGRQLGVVLANFGADQLKRHREAGDLEQWAEGLTQRMLDVLDHPITAGVVSVLEAVYTSPEASSQLARAVANITDPDANPRDFLGMTVAIADTGEFLATDPNLTPVVQFGALVAAPNAFRAIDSQEPPDATKGAAYAAIDMSRAVLAANAPVAGGPKSALARLLQNMVSPSLTNTESPVESMIDLVADVNRTNPLAPSSEPLTADDYRAVFSQLQKFLTDGDRGLERLYKVIQGRN
jgi:hypothetical protein